jgi:hypothetical protein
MSVALVQVDILIDKLAEIFNKRAQQDKGGGHGRRKRRVKTSCYPLVEASNLRETFK